MKELFKILGDKIAAPLWEIERHVSSISETSENSSKLIAGNIDNISDFLFEQNRIHARELEEIKHTLQAISEKEVSK